MKGEGAIEKMEEDQVNSLPVIQDDKLLGYIFQEDLLDKDSMKDDLRALIKPAPNPARLHANQHIYEILALMEKNRLDTIAVESEAGQFLGVVSHKSILEKLGQVTSFKGFGAIIVVEMRSVDYSLAEITRLLEYNDVKIMGLLVVEGENNMLDLHMKLNTTILKNTIATLERYDYKVVATYSREDVLDNLEERYRSFMKYLDT